MPHENPPLGWYVAATNGYLNKDGTIQFSCNTNAFSDIPAWQQPESGYWKTYELALEAKKIYEGSWMATYGFATNTPKLGPKGWFVYISGVSMHLCTDCIPRKIYTTLYDSNMDLFYFETEEEANRARNLYMSYSKNGPKDINPTIAIPEPQLVVYELENPTKESIGWCVYTNDTGYYSYALSKDNTICHTAYRKHWDTENAALFAKLCYERKMKHLKK